MPKEKEETNFLYKARGNSAKARERTKEEINPRLLEALFGRVNEEGKIANFAHEYVIFYRRGNYLIEGNPSPINRALILIIFSFKSFRD